MRVMTSVELRSVCRIITPEAAAILGANGLIEKQVTETADDLEANVFVLGPIADPVIIVTCDLLYVGQALRTAVLQLLEEEVHDQRFLFAASHTHRAPMLDPTKPGLGEADALVLTETARQIASGIRDALAREPTQCRTEIAYGSHSAGVNRRRRRLISVDRRGIRWGTMRMAPNPLGPVDTGLRRLRFVETSTDSVVAEMWSVALHPTGYPRRDVISADFPGHVRNAIRADCGSSIPVAFFQGFSGDIRPATPPTPWGLRRLLRGPGFAGFSEDQYRVWVEALARDVLDVDWQSLGGSAVHSIREPIQRAAFVEGGQPPTEGALHGIRLGNLAILGVPSEVVVEYSSSLTSVPPLEHVWGVGCIDHVWGYSPTSEMLGEGGYEVHGFCEAFGVEGVNPQVESELRGRIEALIQDLAQI